MYIHPYTSIVAIYFAAIDSVNQQPVARLHSWREVKFHDDVPKYQSLWYFNLLPSQHTDQLSFSCHGWSWQYQPCRVHWVQWFPSKDSSIRFHFRADFRSIATIARSFCATMCPRWAKHMLTAHFCMSCHVLPCLAMSCPRNDPTATEPTEPWNDG